MLTMVDRKNDYAFKRIFGHEKTKDILARFLAVVLKVPIEPDELSVARTEFSPAYMTDKACMLDIQVRRSAHHEKMNIEMQVASDGDLARRVLFYWSKGYIEDLRKGEDYGTLPKMISIIVVDSNVYEWKRKTKFHGAFQVMEPEEGKVFSDALEIHVLELPKMRKQSSKKNLSALECWCLYLDNAKGELMDKIAAQEPLIRRALEEEKVFETDPKERRLYELREKGRRDFDSAVSASAKRNRKEGRQEGLQEGEQKGRQDVQHEVASAMLAKKIPLDLISEFTGLTVKDIKALRRGADRKAHAKVSKKVARPRRTT